MKYIKEYLCDKRTPSDEEIRECLKEELLSGKIVKLNFQIYPSLYWTSQVRLTH